MQSLIRKSVLAIFCLLSLPAAAFADAMVTSPCGNANTVDGAVATFDCVLAGGATAHFGAKGTSGLNFFSTVHSPVTITSGPGQINNFIMVIQAPVIWTIPGPVGTVLTINGMVTIVQPGAIVNITLTGQLGGPALTIQQRFVNSGPIAMTMVGNQAIANLAVSRLEISIVGNAIVDLPNSAEFASIPEPATLFLLGTGLAGVAMKLRRRLRT